MPAIHNFTLINESGSTEAPSDEQFYLWFSTAVGDKWQTSEVDLMLVDAARMAKINVEARGKNKPTNTLAFPFQEQTKEMPLFGEIIMCPSVVLDEANEKNISPEQHWAHLTIHSTLHLMGFDHQNDLDAAVMEQKEIELLKLLGLPNPYQTRGEPLNE